MNPPNNAQVEQARMNLATTQAAIGLYREIAIAIQKESGDSNGDNV